jgi:septal ring factor EnvC (AmiA/AmiB activator)
MNNERRTDTDSHRIFEAIEKMGQRCDDQHEQSQKMLEDIVRTQTIFSVKVQNIETTLDRIGQKVDTTSERTASTETMLNSLRGQNSEQYAKIGKLENKVSTMSARGTESNPVAVSFVQTDNFKWLVGAAVFVSLLVLLAFGSITVSEIKELNPIGGE